MPRGAHRPKIGLFWFPWPMRSIAQHRGRGQGISPRLFLQQVGLPLSCAPSLCRPTIASPTLAACCEHQDRKLAMHMTDHLRLAGSATRLKSTDTDAVIRHAHHPLHSHTLVCASSPLHHRMCLLFLPSHCGWSGRPGTVPRTELCKI